MLKCELYDLDWVKYYWCPGVYKPSDDTLLLIEVASNLNIEGGKVLEIGTGTGIVLAYVLRNYELYGIGVDINPIAAENTYMTLELNNLSNKAEILNCDSITCIREGIIFDIILYNPPYLIGEPYINDYNDIAELGGRKGIDNLLNVLESLLQNRNINSKTRIYIIIPEPPPLNETLRALKEIGFNTKILKTKHFFYEKIHGAKLEKVA